VGVEQTQHYIATMLKHLYQVHTMQQAQHKRCNAYPSRQSTHITGFIQTNQGKTYLFFESQVKRPGMTPVELTTLYSPFLICWFLIWLTNMAEHMPTEKQKTHQPAEKHRHTNTHKAQTETENTQLQWNVSSFLGFGDKRGAA
jgi:hypothetical protein